MKEILGKVKALVRDNADPENRGRIRCYCPSVMGTSDDASHWTGWAEPCFPWLGGLNTLDSGSPLTKVQNGNQEVGVWLEFEQGHPDFPIWVGTWIPAPTTTSPFAQQDITDAPTQNGGSIIDSPPAGSNVSALNPLAPVPNANEARLVTKPGRDIFIGSVGGGGILIGPSGVHITGLQATINGRAIDANPSDEVQG